jgi:hypothetical protein
MRIALGCFLALTLLKTTSAQEPTGELGAVLNLAAKYVAKYEGEQLGNLLVREEYLQSSAEYNPVRDVAGREVIASRNKRRLDSDFLILQVGTTRVGVRLVNKVDGVRIESTTGSLDALEKGSPEENTRMIAAINRENVRYDIGSVLRHTNVPTFALQVLRATEVGRFEFTRNGTEKINGTVTWKIKFAEKRPPALVHAAGPNPKPLFSTGIVWIEPTSGRILKTEFSVENPYSKPKATGRMVVTYVEDKNLGIYVPKEMVERYQSDDGYVDCQAFYSNFRSFGVKVTSEISKPQ